MEKVMLSALFFDKCEKMVGFVKVKWVAPVSGATHPFPS